MIPSFKHFMMAIGLLTVSFQTQASSEEDKSTRLTPVSRARSHRITVISTPNDPGHVTIHDHTAKTITRIDTMTGQVVAPLNPGSGSQG